MLVMSIFILVYHLLRLASISIRHGILFGIIHGAWLFIRHSMTHGSTIHGDMTHGIVGDGIDHITDGMILSGAQDGIAIHIITIIGDPDIILIDITPTMVAVRLAGDRMV